MSQSNSFLAWQFGDFSFQLGARHGAAPLTLQGLSQDESGELVGLFDLQHTWMAHINWEHSTDQVEIEGQICFLENFDPTFQWGVWIETPRARLAACDSGWVINGVKESVLVSMSGTVLAPAASRSGLFVPLVSGKGGFDRLSLKFRTSFRYRKGELVNHLSSNRLSIDLLKDRLWIAPGDDFLGAKIVFMTAKGEMNATMDLYQESPVEIEFSSIGGMPSRLAVVSNSGEVLGDFNLEFEPSCGSEGWSPRDQGQGDIPPQFAEKRISDTASKCLKAFHDQDWEGVLEFGEEELMYNADDPIAWWEMAVGQRKLGLDAAESLANCHFLAPLNPVLKVEALLSSPAWAGEGGNPLVASFGTDGALASWAIKPYLDRKLWADAANWLQELLRFQNCPRLQLLSCWVSLKGMKMEAQSAHHWQAFQRLNSDDLVLAEWEMRIQEELQGAFEAK